MSIIDPCSCDEALALRTRCQSLGDALAEILTRTSLSPEDARVIARRALLGVSAYRPARSYVPSEPDFTWAMGGPLERGPTPIGEDEK